MNISPVCTLERKGGQEEEQGKEREGKRRESRRGEEKERKAGREARRGSPKRKKKEERKGEKKRERVKGAKLAQEVASNVNTRIQGMYVLETLTMCYVLRVQESFLYNNILHTSERNKV